MLRVQDVMTAAVHTVEPESPAEAAWQRMRAERIHHLVVRKGSRILGVLSDRDAGGPRGTRVREGRTAGELMSTALVTVRPDTPVRKAANLMRGRSIGSLVVSGPKGQLVGIVTVSDLLELLGRGVERPVVTSTRWTLNHRAPHRKTRPAAQRW
jgi:CBS domain-containing protein